MLIDIVEVDGLHRTRICCSRRCGNCRSAVYTIEKAQERIEPITAVGSKHCKLMHKAYHFDSFQDTLRILMLYSINTGALSRWDIIHLCSSLILTGVYISICAVCCLITVRFCHKFYDANWLHSKYVTMRWNHVYDFFYWVMPSCAYHVSPSTKAQLIRV